MNLSLKSRFNAIFHN